MVASGLAAIGPTAGAGGACALATGSTCLILTGGALTAEGAMVVGGAVVAGHGDCHNSSYQEQPGWNARGKWTTVYQ